MSRDFILKFKSINEVNSAFEIIKNIKTFEGYKIFCYIQIKNSNLFLSLEFKKEIKNEKVKNEISNKEIILKDYTDFVAIKNGMHDEKGYIFWKDIVIPKEIKIEKIKDLIVERYS